VFPFVIAGDGNVNVTPYGVQETVVAREI
jgi:hypothetical protein